MVDLALAAEVARLAAMPKLEYEICRKAEAERLAVRVYVLDAEVKAARPGSDDGKQLQGRRLELAPPPPWPHPVDGGELLNELARFYAKYLALPQGGATLLSLWTVHTHCFESFRHTPRLAIRSPEKGCGKTTVLDLLEMTTAKPLPTASVTAAAIFRAVEATKPTLLIDEADTFLKASDELRGVLNAGHKQGGQVVRCVGEDSEPRAFAAFAPAAIAAIGSLPGTLQDRSVTLMMRRAIGNERPTGISPDTEAAGRALASRAARWVIDNSETLAAVSPVMPAEVLNRRADNWRPLLAIATLAGSDWRAKAAELAAAPIADDDGSGLLTVLLTDLQTIFDEAGATRLATSEIVRQLLDMDDRMWPEMSGSHKPLSANRLTRMLKPVGALRKQWRIEGRGERHWGFYKDDLADAFARYVGEDTGKNSDVVTSPEYAENSGNGAGDGVDLSPPQSGDDATASQLQNGDENPCHHFGEGLNHSKIRTVTLSPDVRINGMDWSGEI